MTDQPTTNRAQDEQPIAVIVDDEEGIRKLVRRILTIEDYAVVLASSGAAALAALEDAPSPALAIVDLSMPQMDGIELTRRLRDSWPTLPVILMSGFDRHDVRKSQASDDPVTVFLEKPFLRQDLLNAIRSALHNP